MNDNTTTQTGQGATLDTMSSGEKAILNRIDQLDRRFNMVEQQLGSMNSRMRELEANVRDISSIKGAVQRMNVGFQEIPYELNGRAAVEEIKDYY